MESLRSILVTGGSDLIIFAVPGVQRHIAESRTTSDLVSASTQIASLVAAARDRISEYPGATVVFPAGNPVGRTAGEGGSGSADVAGVPNRVVARVPAGTGRDAAEMAVAAVRDLWRTWVAQVFDEAVTPPPGFPDPQWVVVPARRDGDVPWQYTEQFAAGQRAMTGRRRVRSFPQVQVDGRDLCSMAPRWPAVPAPPRVPPHERTERLGAVAWVKRRAPHTDGRARVASMVSIATAPYRADVLARLHDAEVARHVAALHRAGSVLTSREAVVPGLVAPAAAPAALRDAARWLVHAGGPWMHPARWTSEAVQEYVTESGAEVPGGEQIGAGRAAAAALARVMSRLPGTHVAVIAQDLDSLGRHLAGLPAQADHELASRRLQALAATQLREASPSPGKEPSFAVPVYAGGDDLLVLAPAATAISLTTALHATVGQAFTDGAVTASTAVLFSSSGASLQGAVRAARELLDRAKALPGKHGLAVGYRRRSGATQSTVQPWGDAAGESAVAALARLSRPGGLRLSPRLAFDLQRDGAALNGLCHADVDLLEAEIGRLVRRHVTADGGGPVDNAAVEAVTRIVVDLGRREAGRSEGFDPVPAAMVAVFLRQECR